MNAAPHTAATLTIAAAPFAIRSEQPSDAIAREALLDACFGITRDARTCQRLRDGRLPAKGLAFSAVRQSLCGIESAPELTGERNRTASIAASRSTEFVGTVRLWHVSAGGVPALMLGPLAVDPSCRNLGLGGALVKRALAAAKARGYGAVLLLGDAPYYARFGFSAVKTGELLLPGAFEQDRLLALELRERALDGAGGMIVPTGEAAWPTKRRPSPSSRKLTDRAA